MNHWIKKQKKIRFKQNDTAHLSVKAVRKKVISLNILLNTCDIVIHAAVVSL